jgi:hypothetical protein
MKTIIVFLLAVMALGTPAYAAPIAVGEFAFNQDADFPDLFQYFSVGRFTLDNDPLAGIDWTLPALVLTGSDGSSFSGVTLFDADASNALAAGESAITFTDQFADLLASASLDFGTQSGFSLSGPLLFGGDRAPGPAQILYEAPEHPVPEPGTLFLLCSGVALGALYTRRRAA